MKLKNETIVFLGNTKFDGDIKSTSEFIAINLAKNNKVYFIDYPFTFKDYIKSTKAQLIRRKGKFSWFSNGIIETGKLNFKIIIVPPLLPINFLPEGFLFRALRRINEFIIGVRLKKVFRADGIDQFVYFNSFNFHYPNLASLIKPSLTIYHCVDPMIVPYDMKHGIEAEKILVSTSDLVICTSKELYLEKKRLNKNTYFVPNGADLGEEISQSSVPNIPGKERFIRPIVGYLGTIERRIDYDLVSKLLELHPDKTFVFAGPVSPGFMPERFHYIPNLHIIGKVAYEDVPSLIQSFDVAIIPFKKDKVSRTIFPIKLFEYLNAGKHVICTDFNPDLRDFTNGLVDYCVDVDSFSISIDQAIRNDSPAMVVKRKALAKEHTWEKRAEKISEVVQHHLSSLS